MKMKLYRNASALLAALTILGCNQLAAEQTAFDLIKEGNKYVGEQAKDKVVQIRSEPSIGGLTPTIWYVVYYDPTATLKAVEVKFGAGKMIDVKRPIRLLEPVLGQSEPLEQSRLKVDSDKALDIAKKEPLLEKLTLKSAQLKLERGSGEVVWKIKFWAEKQTKPGSAADVGEVYVSAETGKVVKSNLHINSAF